MPLGGFQSTSTTTIDGPSERISYCAYFDRNPTATGCLCLSLCARSKKPHSYKSATLLLRGPPYRPMSVSENNYGSEGCRFESCPARHRKPRKSQKKEAPSGVATGLLAAVVGYENMLSSMPCFPSITVILPNPVEQNRIRNPFCLLVKTEVASIG